MFQIQCQRSVFNWHLSVHLSLLYNVSAAISMNKRRGHQEWTIQRHRNSAYRDKQKIFRKKKEKKNTDNLKDEQHMCKNLG